MYSLARGVASRWGWADHDRVRTIICIIVLLSGFIASSSSAGAAAQARSRSVLQSLRDGHPRLLVIDEDLERLKKTIASDPTARAYFERVRAVADDLLDDPVSERVIIGPRLLHISRQVLVRVQTLGGLYRLTGEQKYADRAKAEMLAAARFQDWNPSHFLDVAEMTNALGIGYDWLHDLLTPAERDEIRKAIIQKGLEPGMDVYRKRSGWHTRTNNWNQVCNGGLAVGALAIADEEPELAGRIISEAKKSLPIAMAEFSDGGCIEGPGYWGYATLYISYYAAAMQSALGDTSILESPGLSQTGLFRIHSIGPIERTFNFGDGGEHAGTAAQMFYFARAFKMPAYAAHERSRVGAKGEQADALHLLWYNPEGSLADITRMPTAASFERIDVGLMRSRWNDPNAAFVGFKGGDNAASHANLDLGTFVYDVNGIRWATELGADDYNLPGYFGGKRWTYYRMRTEGQNTLTLDGENQNVKAKSKITTFDADKRSGTVDLTAAYAGQVESAKRTFELTGKRLAITDELNAPSPVEVTWHMHTDAKIEVQSEGRRAVLSRDGKQVVAQIIGLPGARFEVAPADPEPAAKANPPMRKVTRHTEKLVVRLPEKVSELRLRVELAPQ